LGGVARQEKQRPGETPVQVFENGMFHVLVSVPQTVAEHLEKLKAHVGPMFKKRDEFASVEDEQFTISDRCRVGGSPLTVKQRNFPEYLAGL
jgi:hypothetical protein